ncbi:MAG: NAD-dependent epimerase/dehydratase family protein [Planctomycetes bacterium]|nr:NAD-dependent epimerase/dehydratase family protein [Planctomycetota bacterium]
MPDRTAPADTGPSLALVTGGTGFVGAAVVRAALREGLAVRALVREGSDRRNLAGLDVETCAGDLREPTSLRRAVAGCRYVFHVAAEYRIWHPRPETFDRVNVDGTLALLDAARAEGVERFVYTSSVAVLGVRPGGEPADEGDEPPEGGPIGAYKRSKWRAERAVRELAARADLDVVTVNPAAPVGPGDVKPTPTGRTILEAAKGNMPAYVDTGLNVVHVDDVAAGHLLALRHGRRGERYVLGGENLSLRAILAEVATQCGRRPPRIRLAPGLLLPLAHVAQAWARLRGGTEPMLTVDGLRMARYRMFFSSAKAERELGYRARPAREAIRDALAWFRAQGYLPAARSAASSAAQ